MIVEKAVKMADLMNVPIIGIVENMSYFKCPDCGKEHKIFGESHIEQIASKYGIGEVAKLAMDPQIATSCDRVWLNVWILRLLMRWLKPVSKPLTRISTTERLNQRAAAEAAKAAAYRAAEAVNKRKALPIIHKKHTFAVLFLIQCELNKQKRGTKL